MELGKETFAKLFDAESDHDFTALDRLMPHPVYARNHFVCVLSPSDSTFESIRPLLKEAHAIAMGRIERRKSSSKSKSRTRL
jgi:hypothetical protein